MPLINVHLSKPELNESRELLNALSNKVAALTGKPIYIADIPAKRDDQRFKKFRELFAELNIIKNLNENLEIWTYNSLNETARIAEKIKKELLCHS